MGDESAAKRGFVNYSPGAGVGVGAALGVALGAAVDHLALGLALGTAFGAAVDVAGRLHDISNADKDFEQVVLAPSC